MANMYGKKMFGREGGVGEAERRCLLPTCTVFRGIGIAKLESFAFWQFCDPTKKLPFFRPHYIITKKVKTSLDDTISGKPVVFIVVQSLH